MPYMGCWPVVRLHVVALVWTAVAGREVDIGVPGRAGVRWLATSACSGIATASTPASPAASAALHSVAAAVTVCRVGYGGSGWLVSWFRVCTGRVDVAVQGDPLKGVRENWPGLNGRDVLSVGGVCRG